MNSGDPNMLDFERGRRAGKVMFYSHDTFGLGHLRRTLAIANHLQANAAGLSQLIVTGSPAASAFPLPAGADFVKLPSVTKDDDGTYVPRSLDTSFQRLRDMRAELVLGAAKHFRPDVLIVDHAPAGLKGEMLPALRWLEEHLPQTRLVLGMRDIIDAAPVVRQAWSREGVYDLLDTTYDAILGYGQRDLYDSVREYGFSPMAAAKFRYVGYLGRAAPTVAKAAIRKRIGMATDRLVVVVAGGGGDGTHLMRTAIRGMRKHGKRAPFDMLVIGGPLMALADAASLQDLLGRRRNLHYLQFTAEMTSYLAAADAVVSMGGYNTVCELAAVGTPAIIVPRVAPRQEQAIRARMLEAHGIARMVHPDDLGSKSLLRAIDDLLNGPKPTARLPLDGLANMVDALAVIAPELGLRAAIPTAVPQVAG
jgi:predicted glycosyltransferase